jgi:hypothetical protein
VAFATTLFETRNEDFAVPRAWLRPIFPSMTSSLATSVERLKRVTGGGSKSCGWMFDEVAFLLYSLVKFYKPDLVIQTGHLWGKSACVVLEALTDGFLAGRGGLEEVAQNADKKFATFVREHSPISSAAPRMFSIDPWPHLMDIESAYDGVEMLKRQYPGQFEFFKMKSGQFFEEFKQDISGLRLMGIVDGDHTPEGCLLDLKHFARLNAEAIVVDDTNWLPELKEVTVNFAREANYTLMNFDLYNGVGFLARKR